MTRRSTLRGGVVKRFLKLVARMEGGEQGKAVRAYRTLMRWTADDKEELIFRTQEKCAAQKRRFINLNNRLIAQKFNGRSPKGVLLLVPFCLQRRACVHHIAWNVENCKRCGRCPIGGLRAIADEYGMRMRVAVRSAFAPSLVREVRPELVLAVACEDELLSGLLRIAPRDCYGILNVRPEGPCRNTSLDLRRFEAEAARLLNHRQEVRMTRGERRGTKDKGRAR